MKKTKELQEQGKKINLSLSEMSQFFMKMAELVMKKVEELLSIYIHMFVYVCICVYLYIDYNVYIHVYIYFELHM
jgi:hypothetical protein